ncbi:hypothetical protein MIR68_006749 [Amoeboaphelidium protococcarum]|nr:hypothetical protein MIR68_006749 [Amoeboaphelidium protococcarum]
MSNQNTFTVCPTGSGKSFIYLALQKLMPSKSVLVVTPTIALEKDASDKARQLGFTAVTNYATLLQDIASIHPSLIFVAVEHLEYGTYHSLMTYLVGTDQLGCIVIDEIHVYILWQAFRPQMLNLSLARLYDAPLIMLSATLPNAYIRDIVRDWQLKAAAVRLLNVKPATRYSRVRVSEAQALALIQQKARQLEGHGKMAVFCYRIADVTNLQRSVLVPAGQYYHALEDKDTQMSNFMNGNTNVMICSSSFGLGVDIANIRAVYHYGPSYTLIDYVQETGRAGRDGHPCEAILLDVGKARHVKDPLMTLYCRDLATCRRELMHREIDGEDLMTCNRQGIANCDNCALPGRQVRPDQPHINWRERLRIEQFGDEDASTQHARDKIRHIHITFGKWKQFCSWTEGMCLICYRRVLEGQQAGLCNNQHMCTNLHGRCFFCLGQDHTVDMCREKQRAIDNLHYEETCGCLVPIEVHGSKLHDFDGIHGSCKENGRKAIQFLPHNSIWRDIQIQDTLVTRRQDQSLLDNLLHDTLFIPNFIWIIINIAEELFEIHL